MNTQLHINAVAEESTLYWSYSLIAPDCWNRSQVVESLLHSPSIDSTCKETRNQPSIVSTPNETGTMVATTSVNTTQWTQAYQNSSARSSLQRRAIMHPIILAPETGLTDVLNCKTLQSWLGSQQFKWWNVSRRRTWANQRIDMCSTVDLELESPSPCPTWPTLVTLTAG